MMMYDDLIKQLRYCADATTCRNCFWKTECCPTDMQKKAADAIEELRKAVLRLEDESGIYDELPTFYIYPTKWIPVTERLPEEPYGCLAVVWDNPRYGDGDMFLNYYPEFVGFDGTWNDADGEEIPLDVVYWMRLPQIPEPPKDGE